MDLGLTDVAAAVSGASKGLGRAVAEALAREGARVAICSRDADAIRRTADEIGDSTGADVAAFVADVSTPDGPREFIVDAVKALGGLQVLVVNAGGPPPGASSIFNDEQWGDAIDLNFMSAVRLVREAVPHLAANNWGRVLAITSVSVKQPMVGLGLSSAVRAATTGFLKTMSVELGPRGITVNAIMPGQFATDRLRFLAGAPPEAGPDHEAFASMAAEIPLGRIGDPSEFGAVAAFICSQKASFLTGVSLPLDGGLSKGLL